MAVYHSKFATKGTLPRTVGPFRHTKRVAAVIGIAAITAAAVFGLWRATLGVPEPVDLPGVFIAE